MKKKILLFVILLLFNLFTAYNFYMWKYATDFNTIKTGLNTELEELRELTNNTIVLNKIDDIEAYVNFQQALFIGDEE